MMTRLKFVLLIGLAVFLSKPSGAQEDKNAQTLQILANITGHDMYTSFVQLGTLADAYMYKAYTQNFALKLLSEYVDYMDIVISEMQKMIDTKIVSGSDIDMVKIQINAYQQMKTEAKEFKSYVETGESKYIESYETARRIAWKNIAQMLGLPQDVDPIKDKKK